MPTTISLVRGTATVTANGSSSVTLFTNGSSGIATRVIVNQIGWQGNGTASNTTTAGGLYILGSGVGETQIGFVVYGSTIGSSGTLSLIPSQNGSSAIGANQNGTYWNSGYLPIVNGWPQLGASTANRSNGSALTQTFWIGPNDQVTAKAYGYTPGPKGSVIPATWTVRYSFTLITES